MATQNYDVNLNVKTNGAEEATKKIADLNKEADKAASSSGGLGKFSDKISETGSNLRDLASGDIGAASGAVRSLAGAFAGATGVVVGFAAAGVAVFAAVEGIGAQMAAAADDAAEFADKLGVTTFKLEALKLVADENSGSVEGLQRVYDKLSKSMTKLDEDNEKTAYAFKVLGISAEEAGKMTETELAGRIIKAYEDLGRSAKATAAVQQLIGGAFREQIPAIKAAYENMDEYLARVREFGGEASEALKKKGAEQEVALSNLGGAWKQLKNQIAEFSTGIATDVAQWAANVLKSIADVMKAWREGRAQTAAREDSISPGRRAEIARQAATGLPSTLNPAERRAEFQRRKAQLESEEQNMLFRRMEAGQTGASNAAATENARIAAARVTSTAVKPIPNGSGRVLVQEVKVNGIDDAFILKQLEEQRSRDTRAEEARQALITRQNELAQRGVGGITGIGGKAADSVAFADRTRGMGAVDKETMAGLDDIYNKTNESIANLDKSTEGYTERVKALKDAEAEATATLITAGEDRKRSQENWLNGALDAFTEYQDAARDVAGQTKDMFTNAFKGMEDALVNFAMTGKLSFADMAKSIIADLIRIQIRAAISGVLGMITGAISGAIGSGASAGSSMYSLSSGGSGVGLKFADGGVVNRATPFMTTDGQSAVMGEAGPEAILPLKRGANGQLGVQMSGGSSGGGVTIGSISIVVQGGNTNEETGATLRKELTETMKQIADGRIANARRSGGLLNAG